MSMVKSKTKKVKEQTDSNRRSFLWKAGAAVSAGLAATVPGMAKTNNEQVDRLSRQVARLEDDKAIRALHRTYENLLDSGRYSDVAGLFTDNAEVIFNGGVYLGKDRGINRLYSEHFSAGMTGRKIEPAHGFLLNEEQLQDVIELAENGKTAKARFPYSIQVGAPIQDDSVLVQMARLHGEGIRKWWEGGIYDISYMKDTKDGSWKMARLEHRALARAEGRSQAKAIAVAPFNKVYPEEPTGPDMLIT